MMQSTLSAIGNTPLVPTRLVEHLSLYAKLEYLNFTGSVKDRSALYLIEQAEKRGELRPGSVIIDASSGNHGISLACIGSLKGYQIIIVVSEKISAEKLATIRAYGAQVVVCPITEYIDDPRSYHSVAKLLHSQIPNSYMPNHYYNVENRCAHYHLLGPEIWQQTDGNITHFFAAAGTGGTISGVGTYLKEKNKHIKIIAVDSASSFHATKGNPKPYQLEGMGIDFQTDVLSMDVLDDIITVTDAQAIQMLKRLAQAGGFLVGPSSGAVAWAAEQYAHAYLKPGDLAVMIFGDSGRAYLTKGFYGAVKEPIQYAHIDRRWIEAYVR
jgi:cystathionine beta-synthase